MTDLERLEEAWPLGWVESEDWVGWIVRLGAAEMVASFFDGSWKFFLYEDDDSLLIGEGSLDTAARHAMYALELRARSLLSRAFDLNEAAQAFVGVAERSEA